MSLEKKSTCPHVGRTMVSGMSEGVTQPGQEIPALCGRELPARTKAVSRKFYVLITVGAEIYPCR